MTDLATTLAGSTPPTRSLSAIKESLLRKGVPWTPGALRGVMDTAARKGYEVDFDMPIRFGGGVPERISTGFEGGWKGAINSLETEGAALVNKVGLDDDHSMMNTALDRGQQIASDTFIPDRGLLEDVSSAVGSSAPMMGASLAATALSGGNPYVGLMTGVTMESMMEQGGSIQEILAATEESKRADRADGILGETADVFGKNMLINSAFAGVGGSLARAAGGKTLASLLTGPAIKSGLGKSLVDAASESTQEFLQSLASQGRAHESLGHDISYRQAAYEGLIALPIGLAGGGVASAYERMVQAASEVAASEVRKKLKEDLTGRAQPVKDKASELKDKAQGVQNKVSDLRSKAGRTAGKVSGKAREVYESAQDQIDDFNRGAREAYAEESGLTVEQVEEQMATKAPINFFSMVDAAKTVDQVTKIGRAHV